MTIEFTAEQKDHIDKKIGLARMEARDVARKEIEVESQTAKEHAKELKELREQVKIYKTKFDEIMGSALDTALLELPEDAREMVSELPGDVDTKLAWIEKYKDVLNAKPGDGVGNRGTPPAKPLEFKTNYKPRKGL